MPSINAYSRHDCQGCRVKDALHKYGECVHCGTLYEYERIADDPRKGRDFKVKRAVGTSRRAGGRKRGGSVGG